MAYGSTINAKTLSDGDAVRAADVNSTSDILARWNPAAPPIGSIIQYLKDEDPGNLAFFRVNGNPATSHTLYVQEGQTATNRLSWTPKDKNGDALEESLTSAGVAFNPTQSEVLVLNRGVVYVYTQEGTYKRHVDTGYSTSCRAITVDPSTGNLIISDFNSGGDPQIRVFSGITSTESSNFNAPGTRLAQSLAVDHNGNLIVGTNATGATIYVQSGISSTNTTSWTPANTGHTYTLGSVEIQGVGVDHLNGNLISITFESVNDEHIIHIHSGITSTYSSNTGALPGDAADSLVKDAAFLRFDSIPDGWVEATGQTLSDSESPWDGRTLPDLSAATVVDADAVWIMRIK